jgi:hypothetical protein
VSAAPLLQERAAVRPAARRARRAARRRRRWLWWCAASGLGAFVVSTIWAATLAERDEFEAGRMARAAQAVRAATEKERDLAERRLGLRQVDVWADQNGFVDGAARPEAQGA